MFYATPLLQAPEPSERARSASERGEPEHLRKKYVLCQPEHLRKKYVLPKVDLLGLNLDICMYVCPYVWPAQAIC